MLTFEQENKKQFISFPFTVGEVTTKNTSHADILVNSLDAVNLGEAKTIEGFDRGKIFNEHLDSIKYGKLFPRSRYQSEEVRMYQQNIKKY